MIDRDVHTWFSLSYANYYVVPRAVLQSMPEEWQHRWVALQEELEAKMREHDIELPTYKVEAAHDYEYIDLGPAYLEQHGITREWVCASECDEDEDCGENCGGGIMFFTSDGGEHDPYDRLLVATGTDPLSNYARGRRKLW